MIRYFIFLYFISFTHAQEIVFQKFIKQYCSDCHNDDKQKGDLNLNHAITELETWESLKFVLEDREMPPKKKEQPTPKQLKQVLAFIHDQIKSMEKQPTMIQLTQQEIQNSINDLLSTQFDLSETLPNPSTSSHHEALHFNPDYMDQYIQTSEFLATQLFLKDQPITQEWSYKADQLKGTNRGDFYKDQAFYLTTNYPWRSNVHAPKMEIKSYGRYHFEMDIEIIKSDEEQIVGVNLGDPRYPTNFEKVMRLPLKPGQKSLSFELMLHPGDQVSLTFDSAKIWIIRSKPHLYEGPRLKVTNYHCSGPLHDQWPPLYLSKLIGPTNYSLEQSILKMAQLLTHNSFPQVEMDKLIGEAKKDIKSGSERLDVLRNCFQKIFCSPYFLNKKVSDKTLTHKELNQRLSYGLWESKASFDDSIWQNKSLLKTQILSMMKDPKFNRFITSFTKSWLKTSNIESVAPDQRIYENVHALQISAMSKEALYFFKECLNNNLSMLNFIQSDFTMCNDQLASFYGLPPVEGSLFKKVTLPKNSVRGGIIGQAGFLKQTSGPFETSPIHRGVFILKQLYGLDMEPPKDVQIEEPDIRGAKTIKEKMKLHQNLDDCKRCHEKIDPLGMALEHFDMLGLYRDEYKIYTVVNKDKVTSETAEIDSSFTMKDGRTGESISALRKVLWEDQDKIMKHLIKKLIIHFKGRSYISTDDKFIEDIFFKSKENGFKLKDTLVSIISSPHYRTY